MMITLVDFIATRVASDDLATAVNVHLGDHKVPGFVYMGDCFIEGTEGTEGDYTLTIGREIYALPLEQLEAIIYSWCLTEWPESMGVPDDVHAFLCHLQHAMTPVQFALALLENSRDPHGGVCAMQDYCDANQLALEVASDDIDDADALYNAARPFIRGAA